MNIQFTDNSKEVLEAMQQSHHRDTGRQEQDPRNVIVNR